MIRVFYKHPNPAGGYYEAEHSMPVADMAQFLTRKQIAHYGISEVEITRVEEIKLTPPTKGEEDFYAKYGTVGEF